MAVQDIFFTLELLEGEEGETVYEITKRTLTQHFTPHSNIPYERHVFRSMSQQTSESVEQFISRLRIQAETCEFGDRVAVNEQIPDQVIDKCLSHSLRRKLLEKGRTLELDRVKRLHKPWKTLANKLGLWKG